MRKPTVGLRLKIWVIDANGRKRLVRDRLSRSFLQQWIDIWYGHFRNSTSGFSVKRTTGTTAGNYDSHTVDTTVVGITDAFGIVVGSGATAVSVSDYKLESQILDGVTAGKLRHTIGAVHGQIFEETGRKWAEFLRIFHNYTPYEIVVREVGVYARSQSSTSTYYCFVRDVVGNVVAPAYGGLVVKYIFEIAI